MALAEVEPRSWRQWSEFRKVANIVAVNIEIYSQLTSSSVVDSWSTGAETADCKAAGSEWKVREKGEGGEMSGRRESS
jgi:hypothetical protein